MQLPQLHAGDDVNELKVRQGTAMKPGVYQQHLGQCSNYYHHHSWNRVVLSQFCHHKTSKHHPHKFRSILLKLISTNFGCFKYYYTMQNNSLTAWCTLMSILGSWCNYQVPRLVISFCNENPTRPILFYLNIYEIYGQCLLCKDKDAARLACLKSFPLAVGAWTQQGGGNSHQIVDVEGGGDWQLRRWTGWTLAAAEGARHGCRWRIKAITRNYQLQTAVWHDLEEVNKHLGVLCFFQSRGRNDGSDPTLGNSGTRSLVVVCHWCGISSSNTNLLAAEKLTVHLEGYQPHTKACPSVPTLQCSRWHASEILNVQHPRHGATPWRISFLTTQHAF